MTNSLFNHSTIPLFHHSTKSPAQPFYRPSWIEVDLNAFYHNFLTIKKKLPPQVSILAVVKADAYGHGAVTLARKFLQNGGDYLGVSSIEEGIVLRRAGIQGPILILGSVYPYDTFPQIFEFNLTPTVASLGVVQELKRWAQEYQKRLPVQIKVDTGMGRIGVTPESISRLVEEVKESNLILEGVYSHLASADTDVEYTLLQINHLKEIKDRLTAEGINVPYFHIANSTAILRYPETLKYFNLVRPGLLLYGLLPYKGAEKDIEVKPVLSLKTRVVFLKKVSTGKKISYGGTFITRKDSWIATLPIGYADGYSRFLSNPCPGRSSAGGGEVLIKGKRAPIVGRVTMDMVMVDVTDIMPVEVGEEVIIIGEQFGERIRVEDLAEKIGTINYEVVCGLSKRLPRISQE